MLLNLTEYHRPALVADAVALLRAGCGVALLAGGTELVGRHERDTAAVIDLGGLGLAGIEPVATGIAIGAMTTLQALATLPAAGGMLARAAALSAPATIRAAATLGGTLAGQKGGEEIPTVLLALGARVALAEPDLVEVPFAMFLRDRDELLQGAIITRIIIPAAALEARGGFARASRTPGDRAILCAAALALAGDGAAAVAPAGGGAAARVAVGGVEVRPRLCGADTDFAAWAAVGDHLGSAEYRRRVAPVLVRRALAQAMGGARSGAAGAGPAMGGAEA